MNKSQKSKTWYKNMKSEINYSAVMFVDASYDDKLIKKFRQISIFLQIALLTNVKKRFLSYG